MQFDLPPAVMALVPEPASTWLYSAPALSRLLPAPILNVVVETVHRDGLVVGAGVHAGRADRVANGAVAGTEPDRVAVAVGYNLVVAREMPGLGGIGEIQRGAPLGFGDDRGGRGQDRAEHDLMPAGAIIHSRDDRPVRGIDGGHQFAIGLGDEHLAVREGKAASRGVAQVDAVGSAEAQAHVDSGIAG